MGNGERCDFSIIVYVDGACENNGAKNAKGGWAYIIKFDDNKKEIHASGYTENTTNQRMEVTAVIKALEEIKTRWTELDKPVLVLSDSQYAVKGINEWMHKWEKNGWKRSLGKKRKPVGEVCNLDLWKTVFELTKDVKTILKWVKGHSGNVYNELCDALAATSIATQSNYYKIIRKPAEANNA